MYTGAGGQTWRTFLWAKYRSQRFSSQDAGSGRPRKQPFRALAVGKKRPHKEAPWGGSGCHPHLFPEGPSHLSLLPPCTFLKHGFPPKRCLPRQRPADQTLASVGPVRGEARLLSLGSWSDPGRQCFWAVCLTEEKISVRRAFFLLLRFQPAESMALLCHRGVSVICPMFAHDEIKRQLSPESTWATRPLCPGRLCFPARLCWASGLPEAPKRSGLCIMPCLCYFGHSKLPTGMPSTHWCGRQVQ